MLYFQPKKRGGCGVRLIIFLLLVLLMAGCTPPQPAPVSSAKCLNARQLTAYSYDQLSRVAAGMRSDSHSLDDFGGFITALKGTVNDYSGTIQSSTYLSNAVRYLPIPYAGEVSNVTKLVANTLIHLNTAAVTLDRYKKSSTAFLAAFDKLNRSSATPAELAKLSAYADTTLMNDARELQSALQKISSSTATMAATAQSISNALDTTSGYFNQAKSLVGLQPGSNDKVQVTASRDTFNARLALLNQKIVSLENSADTHRQYLSKARTYADLAMQIDTP